ncbi:MAG: hypothetical protein QW543_06995 [Sulfolobales archaeon]
MVKTIKLRDETYKALTMVLGELTADCGKRLTFDNVIATLIDLWFKVGRKQMIRGIPSDNVAMVLDFSRCIITLAHLSLTATKNPP